MSTIRSFSVGNGDMFYINHNSDNFTIIDCCLSTENEERIIGELKAASKGKSVTRFISTHPDDDHLCGIKLLDSGMGILNFYCVKNTSTKPDQSDHFDHYCSLRDSAKVFHLESGCSRKWMNISDEERDQSGIDILWPLTTHSDYKLALEAAEQGESPNNISPIIQYSLQTGVKVLWMGDLETDFMEKIKDAIEWPEIDILFAPHHGRDTGKVPDAILKKLKPKLVVIGEAPSEHLNYYNGYNIITQNSTGDIRFDCVSRKVHIFVDDPDYSVDFLTDEAQTSLYDYYIGTLAV